MQYDRCCFVVMPFGRKAVGRVRVWSWLPWPMRERLVDFDQVYEHVFAPAIAAAVLPEGGSLDPRRTDQDFFTGDIGQEMFQYLEYSRMVLADISGLNANVFYELGHRHRAQPTGTAIFRQVDAPIPFDINQIKAFPYEYEPEERLAESRQLVTRVLQESLQQLRLDSPIQRALRVQYEQGEDVAVHLRQADNAIRRQQVPEAIDHYLRAEQVGENALLELRIALLYRDAGNLAKVIEHADRAIGAEPGFGEAYREKGIAESRMHRKTKSPPTGEESLRRAIELRPEDFDALSSLGGVLKREERFEEALALYERAADVSAGHPYPLLNALTLRARVAGRLEPDAETDRLDRAKRFRLAQVTETPPIDAPWCFFDLSQVLLFQGDAAGFGRWLQEGIRTSKHDYEPGTYADTLQLLADGGVQLPALTDGIRALRDAQARLKKPG